MVDTTAFAQKMDQAHILMGLRQGRMAAPPCTTFSALAGSAVLLDRIFVFAVSGVGWSVTRERMNGKPE